jgi:hypothetical protein
LALPRPLAQVFHASLFPGLLPGVTNLILCPPDAEWRWADPLKESVCAKAAFKGRVKMHDIIVEVLKWPCVNGLARLKDFVSANRFRVLAVNLFGQPIDLAV